LGLWRAPRADDVAVADGEGEGVGDIGGVRGKVQAEQRADHALDLFFAGAPAAGESALDLRSVVVEQGKFLLGCAEANDSAGVAHEDGGAGMGVGGVEFFEGYGIRPLLAQDRRNAGVQMSEALLEGVAGASADDTVGQRAQARALSTHQRPAGGVETGINT